MSEPYWPEERDYRPHRLLPVALPPSGRDGLLLLVWLLLTALLAGGAVLGLTWYAARSGKAGLLPPVATWADYSRAVWPGPAPVDADGRPSVFRPGASGYQASFVWDTCPQAVLDAVPAARNLQFFWPPRQGERYRLAAYPFGSKSSGSFVVDVLKGVLALVNTYEDQGTFPGWIVSVYDSACWCDANPFLEAADAKALASSSPVRSNGSFAPFRWVEVLRGCYALPDVGYPLCDDGGHWFYHLPGAGSWYNVGNVLVRYNKLDAVAFLMAQFAHVCGQVVVTNPPDTWRLVTNLSNSGKQNIRNLYRSVLQMDVAALGSGSVEWESVWASAKQQLAARLDTLKGDVDIFKEIQSVLRKKNETADQGLPVIAYREFAGHSSAAAQAAVDVTVALLGAAAASAVATLVALPMVLAGSASPLTLLALLGAAVGTALAFWYLQIRNLLRGLGWTTLGGALQRHGVDAARALDLLVDPKASDDRTLLQAFSGLAQIQVFDAAIELFASVLGYDCVVMHTQPNKSGTFTAEMVDVTNVLVQDDSGKTAPWAGGLCGDKTSPVPCDKHWPEEAATSGLSRGGLCWKVSAGKDVKVDGGGPVSLYQQLATSAAERQTQKTPPLPQAKDSSAYTSYTNDLFKATYRVACSCPEASHSRCLNCSDELGSGPPAPAPRAPPMSNRLCSIPR